MVIRKNECRVEKNLDIKSKFIYLFILLNPQH